MEYSKHEKERMIQEFEKMQRFMYKKGKAIVFVIATGNIVLSVVSLFTNWNFFALIFKIALSVALYKGVTWVRYLFAVSMFLSVLLDIYVFFIGNSTNDVPAFLLGFVILYSALQTAGAIALLVSKSVGEFLYSQKNG